ncbi:cupin domain-containing protein [Alteromonas sp. 14N.309.X.WAT.G.H12]|uniref:cupin domain-containing protein n=1 Tax=Alteromonas sp. 14N.309.X.WAT.G.H12 TaxID=3120824 RepID=UPI002FD40120
MQVTKISDAKRYDAKLHWGMTGLRLQGMEASDMESFSCSLSYFMPDGGAEWSASPNEKVYIVLDGEITILTKDENDQVVETQMGPMDSCVIGYNETRAVENRTNGVVTMLVVVSA